MSLIRKHGAVLQAWACLALVSNCHAPCGRTLWWTDGDCIRFD